MGWRRMVFFTAVFVLAVSYFWPRKPFHDDLIRGKRILVTGASSGIGEQLAYQYAERGASVFITARREVLLQKVMRRCEEAGSAGAKFGYMAFDMSDLTHTQSLIEAAVASMGGLDQIVLNHAYIAYFELWSDSKKNFDSLQKALDVNIRASAQLAIQAVPHLVEQGGSIGVVSSVAGKIPVPLNLPYVASKFALDGFFSGLRSELMPSNVSVTVAVLGAIDTDTFSSVMDESSSRYKNGKTYEEIKESLYPPASPRDCAYEILRGITLREEEVYFPSNQLIKFIVLTRDIFPVIANYVRSEMMKLASDQ